jgi:serine/threonine-protein kinase
MSPEHDLRIALEALREGLIDSAQLASAARAWANEPTTRLTDLLAAQGSLSSPQRTVIEAGLDRDLTQTLAPPPAEATTAADHQATLTFAGSFANPLDPTEIDPALAPNSPLPQPAQAQTPNQPRFQLLRLHATGGLGEVWLALDRHLGREVALKLIRHDRSANPIFVSRFLDEARINSRLEHPHIVPVYDLVEPIPTPSGKPFYTMRFVRGRTLDEAIALYHAKREKNQARPIDLCDLLDALVAVCRATAYAHSKNVLHRDLKGQNVVLGDFGEVFLLDWGLAKDLDLRTQDPPAEPHLPRPENTHSPIDLTIEGQILGTPSYIAPEQAAGAPATEKSDIYALGVILYRILTSRPPYLGGTPVEILRRIRGEPPAPPRSVIPSIPPPLEAICLKAMARNPDHRYPSPLDLADDLNRWRADEPVQAYREPWTDRLRRWTRRHRSLVAAAAALLLTSVVALAVSNLLIQREQIRTEIARNQAQNNFNLARSAVSGILVDIAQNNLPNLPGTSALRRNVASKAAYLYKSLLNAKPLAPDFQTEAAAAFRQLGSIRRLYYDFNTAEADYKQAITLLQDQLARNPNAEYSAATLAEILVEYAVLLRMQGRVPDEEPYLLRAAELAGTLPTNAAPLSQPRRIQARAIAMLSTVQLQTGRAQDALATSKQAISLIESVPTMTGGAALEFFDRIWASSTLPPAYRELNQLDQAESSARAHSELTRSYLDLAPANNDRRYLHALALVDLAEILALRPQNQADAQAALDDAIPRLEPLTREFDGIPMYRLSLADALTSRGLLHAARNSTESAAADAAQARAILQTLSHEIAALPPTQAILGRNLALLGQLALRAGQHADARSLLDEAARLTQAALSPNPKAPRERQTLARITADRSQLDPMPPPQNPPPQPR